MHARLPINSVRGLRLALPSVRDSVNSREGKNEEAWEFDIRVGAR